jgi:membrane fusion protein (multidrug efflux system)
MATAAKSIDEDATPASSGSKRRFVLPLLIVLAVLGLGWAYKQWSYARGHESTDDAQVDGDMTPVLAKVGGYVQTITVSDNERVAGDSLLVLIDPSEYRTRLAQAEADLAAARASVSTPQGEGQAQAAVQTAFDQRASLDAQVGAAQANLTKANADLGRIKELVAKQIVSKQQLDAAQAAADAAAATLVALQKQQGAASSTISGAQAGVRMATARLAAAQGTVDNARLQLAYTRIVAPMAGLVSRKQAEVGQLVQAGQPLLTIVSDTSVWITANFKETQLSDIRVGQRADIDIDAYPGCSAQGVKLTVTEGCGKDRPLRPGMSVDVHIVTR